MMEALDQQQTKLTSNRDAGEEAGSGGAEAGAGSGVGAACSEEDDFEDPHPALGLAEAKATASDNNNDAVVADKKDGGKRKRSADDVIDLTLANGQSSSDRQESKESEAATESAGHLGEDTAASPGEDDSLAVIEAKGDVTPQPVIDLETDTESGAEKEFQSCKDPKSPVSDREGDVEKMAVEEEASLSSSELLKKDPVDEEVSPADQVMNAVQEIRDFMLEESDTVDSPSLTMDLDHGDFPSSENGEATMGVIKIESESEEEHPGESSKSKGTTASADVVAPIKLNGAHSSAGEQHKDEETQDAEELQQDRDEVEPEEHHQQLSVITKPTGTNDHAERSLSLVLPIRKSRSRTTSCGSSTISSASQPQLVIDHPDNEQSASRVLTQNLSLKRRRSKSSSVSQPDQLQEHQEQQQQQPVDETDGLPSLLLQRLQGNRTVGSTERKSFDCAKCNQHFKFTSVDQLNEHKAMCRGPPTSAGTSSTNLERKKERYFRCGECRSVYQLWNFFEHMREEHKIFICLYCSQAFSSAEKLSLHLENKHDIDQQHTNKTKWMVQRQQRDRSSNFLCCTCLTPFLEGDEFETHDCSQFIQPCVLCGLRGVHAIGCRKNKVKPVKRRRKIRMLPKPSTSAPPPPVQDQPPVHVDQPVAPAEVEPVMNHQQLQSQSFYPAENIPVAPGPVEAPSPPPPAPPSPKLVVPKIMLRVPKEFQKSVDAALSSTDTEEEEMAAPVPTEEVVPLVAAPPEEFPTEAAPPPPSLLSPSRAQPTLCFDDSPAAKLNRVLAELERTKLDIERTKADIITKKQAKVIMAQAEVGNVMGQAADARVHNHHQQQQQHEQPQPDVQRRWSLTPPASPHNNNTNNHHNHMNLPEPQPPPPPPAPVLPAVINEFEDEPHAERRNSLGSDCMDIDDSLNGPDFEDGREREQEEEKPQFQEPLIQPQTPPVDDGILVAGAGTPTVDLQLDRPLDRFSMVDFVRLCLRSVYSTCLYCNHARRIAVNGKQLVLHLIAQHRFTATVDSITAEELYAETIVVRLKSFLPHLEDEYLNSASCCSVDDGMYAEHFNERTYECFTCRFVTSTHKELYTHNRRLHIKSNITCDMCQMNFYSYSEILCHICPGTVGGSIYDLKFRCCLCEVAPLPSAFRLMVHLRKQHQACDICLEDCQTQTKLSAHVWKHKLLHLCYRCGIAYRNKQDISKHLFWKHGTESASCKRCLQKRWRHVYHFCVPPAQFPCEQCGFNFSKAIYLEVHQRMHSGDFRYACAEEGCEEKFVSRKLLLKHASSHVVKELPQEALKGLTDKDFGEKLEEMIKKEEGEETQDGKPAEGKHLPDRETEETDKKEDSESNHKESVKESLPVSKSENRKRRKKSKRSKESLEDLNLIAPNLSESDSSDDSDSDAPRSSHQEQPATLPMRSSVDDLDMPKVMLSPSSESDGDDPIDGKPKLESTEKPAAPADEAQKEERDEKDEQGDTKPEGDGDSKKEDVEEMDVSIWKNLLQNQVAITEEPADVKKEEVDTTIPNQPPGKIHVAWSDHDYCKLFRPPAPSPVKQKTTPKSANKKPGGGNASSDSDSSSCSSSSDSDSSSCSCGTNCSCSSSNSSSSSDDSDDSDSSNNASGSPQKRARKKSLKHKKSAESLTKGYPSERGQEEVDINVTALNEDNPVAPPTSSSPQPPMYNESDFDSAFSDTDEEFYDPHPQKLANELLAQKREALLAEHAPLGPSNNYDIVENSRPSTPSLPEEARAFTDKRERVRNKKKKRERKSTCKSGKIPPMVASTPLPMDGERSGLSAMSGMVAPLEPPIPIPSHQHHHESPQFPITPLNHRHMQPRSEGSSCSDADGQLKRSKRQRRPNKFYGYTSDDENMSAVLAPSLQVGTQLIKPQPPPQLTWAKEDLPTPPKQRSRNNNSSHHHSHSHSNGGTGLAGSSRKRSKQRSMFGAGGSQPPKRHKPNREDRLPPIPTLKIRPSLLPTAPPTDSSESSSDDEDVEVNVTSLVATPRAPAPPSVGLLAPPVVTLPAQPPPPAATAFNQPIPPALLPNPGFATLQYFKANNIRYPIRPPAGARLAREGESVYCYCRCPYDEVSEMIACDGANCLIEWFHFECVGIMVAPQGKWFCAECRSKYSDPASQVAKPQ